MPYKEVSLKLQMLMHLRTEMRRLSCAVCDFRLKIVNVFLTLKSTEAHNPPPAEEVLLR